MGMRRVGTKQFSVAISGTTSAEDGEIFLRRTTTHSQSTMPVDTIGHIQELVVIVDTLITGATIEIDVLKEGKENDLDNDNSWHLNVETISAAGASDPIILYAAGVRARFISAAASGTMDGQFNYLY